MNYPGNLKKAADTYYFKISKIALFITALFSIFIMCLVNSMNSSPELAIKYYFEIPGVLKNVLLICAASLTVGAVFEAGTN